MYGKGRSNVAMIKRLLALDLSLRSPGFADLAVKNRRPSIVRTAHFKTTNDEPRALSYESIEAFTLLFIREQTKGGSVPYDAIVRETWPPARNYENNDKVHGAWSAVDRALARYGWSVTENLSPSTVKKTVTGSGSATKDEVAAVVRKILGLPSDYKFATDDESDAVAVGLAYLIREGLIDV